VTALRQTITSLRQRPGRAFLTALGTALGIATILALLAVSDGAKQTAGRFIHLGRSDLGLFQKDAADPTTSVLPESLAARLRREPGIAGATPLQLLVEDVPHNPGAVVFGAEPGNFLTGRLVFSSGRMFTGRSEAVVGDRLASQLHVGPGGILTVAHHQFRVSGVYHIGVAYQDSGAFIPLASAQAISGHAGEATTIAIKLGTGTKPAAAKKLIASRFPGIAVISDPEEATRAGANGELISQATLVIAVLALLIGGIGVMNTMLMSVSERRTEFALLSAVGWSGPQVAWLVFVEGVVVSFIGAAIGLVIGSIGAQLLVRALGAQALVSPDITEWDLGRALLVGILIGVLGGLYPAWRASHLSPAHVLAER
jgi:putative ABC transport system permease protein